MTLTESKEFAEDKLLTFLTAFTSDQVRKLFDTERSTALRSNNEFYSFDGAVISIYKIEIFVKPPPVKYPVSPELYNSLTNDSSLTSSVMLQALSILNIQSQAPTPTVTSPYDSNNYQVNATDFRSYSRDRNDSNRTPSSSYSGNFRSDRPPYKDPNSHRSNPRYVSPARQNRTPSRERERKPQDRQSRDRQSRSREREQGSRQGRSTERQPNGNRPRQKSEQFRARPRSFSNSRGNKDTRPPNRPTTPNQQRSQGYGKPSPSGYTNDPRARSRSQNGERVRSSSRDRPTTQQPQSRDNSRGRQGRPTFQRRESRDRTRSTSQGSNNNVIDRSRSREKKGASAQPSRSPSRDRPRFCPYCGGDQCKMAECNVFEKKELSYFPCEVCPIRLMHRTSAHSKMV